MHRYYIYIISLPSMSNPNESLSTLSNYWHLYHYYYKHTHICWVHLVLLICLCVQGCLLVFGWNIRRLISEEDLMPFSQQLLTDWSSSSHSGELLDFFYSHWHLTWSCQYVGLSEETILLAFHGYSIPVLSRRHWQQISWSSVSWYLLWALGEGAVYIRGNMFWGWAPCSQLVWLNFD